MDIVVFVCAAQRYASKPQIQHVRRLNKLLTWIQRNPRRLVYKSLASGLSDVKRSAVDRETMKPQPHTHLRILSDAAYKKETEDGYSLRGALYCRCSGHSRQSFEDHSSPVHIVDWACKSQRHVTRSTFSAELLAAGDAFDQGLLTSHLLYEIEFGPLTTKAARDRRMCGGYSPIALYVDAKSVFAVVTATFVKTPAEKSLLCHVQYLRELLDKDVSQQIVWIDTRDMCADGLTKGAVQRTAIQEIMNGTMQLRHECERWPGELKAIIPSDPQPKHLVLPTCPLENSNVSAYVSCVSARTVRAASYGEPRTAIRANLRRLAPLCGLSHPVDWSQAIMEQPRELPFHDSPEGPPVG